MERHDGGCGDNGGGDNDQGDTDNEMCTTAGPVLGAMVQEARLSIAGAGATWEEVELTS
ncbi:MAG TPA: hypothetical protein VMJ65_26380 [Solirubrobacteraceae bacterium]|nr:hypothetical protein [Solirubrobacteraceae bacterium]